MKPSSILMSSFATLLILVSVSENSLKKTVDLSIPNQTVTKSQLMEVVNNAPSVASIASVSKFAKDFSYLKFNLSDFVTTEAGDDEMPVEADFALLKFKVADYIETGIGVLPGNSDFEYLKFDVNNYSTDPCDDKDLPSGGFDYLKFDIQKYVQNNSVVEINELPQADNQ